MKKIILNDGSLVNLSEGAQMTTSSSINELIENILGKNPQWISINYYEEKRLLEILAKEENDLTEDNIVEKLYSLGVGHEMKTQDNGVGKYNQGHKYAVAYLIGKGNKGTVRVDCKNIYGEKFAIEHQIDYTGTNYTDQNILTREDGITYDEDGMGEATIRILIKSCRKITNKELVKQRVYDGLRYRPAFVNSDCKITINNMEVTPQDRLYTHLGKERVRYQCVMLPFLDNEKAALLENVDLEGANILQSELIPYDCELNRKKGVNCTDRGAIEVVYNNVTVIDENLRETFKILAGLGGDKKDFQPSASSFRGRLTIYDKRLYDRYFYGGNKSCMKIRPEFMTDDETLKIRQAINTAHTAYLNRHKDLLNCGNEQSKLTDEEDDVQVYGITGDSNRKTFHYDKQNKILEVNEDCPIFEKYKAWELLPYALSLTTNGDYEKVCDILIDMEYNIQRNERNR